ncbi:LexA family transcriptional regulator [Leptolyngbya sp. AN03gr2]|uniref:LexA family transcriptional regulator n=1 Tax=unclassified Leptolyngbya TaxID=2650499 RepID=UPI003D31FFEF
MSDRSPKSRETSSARDEGFISRLKQVIEEYGSINSLARAANLSESSIRKWRDGTAEPSRDRLVALAEAVQVRMDWLAAGKGPMRQDYPVAGKDAESKNLVFQALETAKLHIQMIQGLGDYYVYVIDNRNMVPTLYPEDLCVFDKNQNKLEALEEGIYAIRVNNAVVIRRIQHILDNQVVAVKDNSSSSDSDIVINLSNPSDSLAIVGRMIYFCRTAA